MSDDGGLAFPQTTAEHVEADGMTLLDWFAGQAMIALAATSDSFQAVLACANKENKQFHEMLPFMAYDVAEQAIAEKRRREKDYEDTTAAEKEHTHA